MPERYDDAHIHNAFDGIVRAVERGLQKTPIRIGAYPEQVVAARTVQRIVELTQAAYARDFIKRCKRGEDPHTGGAARLELGGVYLDTATGAVGVSARRFLTSIAEYLGWATYAVFTICFRSTLHRSTAHGAATLVFGVGAEALFESVSDAGFVAYCEKGPIVPLSSARRLVVQAMSPQVSSRPGRISYDRFPLYALARATPAGVDARIRFAGAHVLAAGRFLIHAVRCPLTVLIAQDLAHDLLVKFLDAHKAIENVVITNSNFGKQPLWMRSAQRHYTVQMVWYSQNIIPFVHARHGIAADFPAYRHMAIDVAWVWTLEFADYLRGLGVHADFQVVGPILWQLPQAPEPVADKNEIRIAVFDVAPVRAEVATRIGVLNYYYSAQNMGAFLRGIATAAQAVESMTGKRVRILLKHKRAQGSIHDSSYQSVVDELSTSGQLELVPPQTNMYAFLTPVDCAIVVPYSSPAYVASYLQKPSFFYDATAQLVPTYLPAANVGFAASPEALADAVLAALHGQSLNP